MEIKSLKELIERQIFYYDTNNPFFERLLYEKYVKLSDFEKREKHWNEKYDTLKKQIHATDEFKAKKLKEKNSELELKIRELNYIISDLQVTKESQSSKKTDTEKAYENLSFSFKALASAAGKLAEENEKMKKIIDTLKSCGSCKYIEKGLSEEPCKS